MIFRYNWAFPITKIALLPLLMLLIGCGGPPANNPILMEAQENFEAANTDESIVRLAPVKLKEAEEALGTGMSLWQSKADKTEVDHYAYIASQKTLIARETALYNAAQQEISRGENERQQVILDVRRADAQRSEERAERAQAEAAREREAADEARASAESSRQLAEELAEKVGELEARPTERGLVLTLGDVLFDFGESNLKSGGMDTVNKLGRFLNEYPERRILIEGFTDSVGSEAFNKTLSTMRAESVKDALMNNGVRSDRVRVLGYGIQHPVASNNTAEGRRQNRRVEVVISDENGVIKDRTGSDS